MMFQRGEPSPSDPHLGSFYGLAMPLLKHGLAVEPVQIEAVALKGDFLSNYRLLLLTYEGQKPPTPAFHEVLAEWVKGGGALVVVDDDTDPYLAVRAWWNTAPYSYRTPREHLFERLGLPADFTGTQGVEPTACGNWPGRRRKPSGWSGANPMRWSYSAGHM